MDVVHCEDPAAIRRARISPFSMVPTAWAASIARVPRRLMLEPVSSSALNITSPMYTSKSGSLPPTVAATCRVASQVPAWAAPTSVRFPDTMLAGGLAGGT